MNNHCKKCGELIKRRHRSAIYCLECVHEIQREAQLKYNSVKRGSLKKHFGDTCIFCNSERQHYHHLDLNNKNNSKQNLIGLCSSCHKKIHYLILKPFFSKTIKYLIKNQFNVNQIILITGFSKHSVYKYIKKQKQI